MSTDPLQELPLLVARSAGVVALLLAALATFTMLAVGAGRVDAAEGRRVGADLGLAAALAFVLHGLALLFTDLPPGLAGVLLPFASEYRPFAVTLGVLAGWGLLAAVVVARARPREGSPAALLADALGPLVVALAGLHALTAGADAGSWWMTLGALGLAAGLLAFGALALQARGALAAPTPREEHPAREARGAWEEHPARGERGAWEEHPVREDPADAPTHVHEPVAAAPGGLWGSRPAPDDRSAATAERWDDEPPAHAARPFADPAARDRDEEPSPAGSLWSGRAPT